MTRMGLLDLPAPLLAWLDAAMAVLPAPWRVVLWGAAAGLISMWLYRTISPQHRIARARQQQLELRRRLDRFDGELAEAWPLIRRLLRTSLTQVGRVSAPAVVASLPVLCVLVWLSTAYGYQFPGDAAPAVRASPPPLTARWSNDGAPAGGGIIVVDPGERRSTGVTVTVPVPVIERWRWWNLLVGNPAGYLDAAHPANRLDIDLPRRSVLSMGPGWMRGWEFPFFVSLLTVSLVLKRVMRIH